MNRIPLTELTFTFARSSGPGGQNVNKVNSKCVLRWNLALSPSVSPDVRSRFLAAFGNRVSSDGELVLASDTSRDQKKNQAECIRKLEAMLASVVEPPKRRKKTRPSFGSKQDRLSSKKIHGQKKAARGGRWD